MTEEQIAIVLCDTLKVIILQFYIWKFIFIHIVVTPIFCRVSNTCI